MFRPEDLFELGETEHAAVFEGSKMIAHVIAVP